MRHAEAETGRVLQSSILVGLSCNDLADPSSSFDQDERKRDRPNMIIAISFALQRMAIQQANQSRLASAFSPKLSHALHLAAVETSFPPTARYESHSISVSYKLVAFLQYFSFLSIFFFSFSFLYFSSSPASSFFPYLTVITVPLCPPPAIFK